MKYILITGAGGGMGRETAQLFASEGYTVFALDKSASEADEVSKDIAKRLIKLKADLAIGLRDYL